MKEIIKEASKLSKDLNLMEIEKVIDELKKIQLNAIHENEYSKQKDKFWYEELKRIIHVARKETTYRGGEEIKTIKVLGATIPTDDFCYSYILPLENEINYTGTIGSFRMLWDYKRRNLCVMPLIILDESEKGKFQRGQRVDIGNNEFVFLTELIAIKKTPLNVLYRDKNNMIGIEEVLKELDDWYFNFGIM